MALKDWEESRDTALRCIASNDKCIEALMVEIIFLLARTGNYQEVISFPSTNVTRVVVQCCSPDFCTETLKHFDWSSTCHNGSDCVRKLSPL